MKTYTYRIEPMKYADDPTETSDYLSFLVCTTRGRYADDRNDGLLSDLCYDNAHRMKAEDRDAVNDGDYTTEELVSLVEKYNLGIVEERSTQYQTWCAIIPYPTVKKEYGHVSRKTKDLAHGCARAELDEFVGYLNGEVYGWIVDSEDEEHIDSVWGYYGDAGYRMAEEDAEEQIAYLEKKDHERTTSQRYAYA